MTNNGEPSTPSTWHFHLNYNLIYLSVIAVLAVSTYQWLHEHDLRIKAEDQERFSEAILKQNEVEKQQLRDEVASIKADRDAKVAALQKKKDDIKTPQQAVAAIPDLTGLPANSFHPLANGNYEVEAPATIVIAQQLQQGQIWKVQLDACTELYGKEQKMNELLTSDNTELKKEKESWKKASGSKGFLGHLWGGTKIVGIAAVSVLVGYGIHH